jgi:hypothetical protein
MEREVQFPECAKEVSDGFPAATKFTSAMSSRSSSVFSSLVWRRPFEQSRPKLESCGFCAAELPENHEHLLEAETRKLECVCRGCAILFTNQSQKYERVPRSLYTH